MSEYPRDNQKHCQFLNVLKFRNEWEKSNSFTIEFLNILTLGFLDLDAYHNCIIYLFLFFLPPIADIFDSVKLTFAMCFFLSATIEDMKMDVPSLKVSHFELLNERRHQDIIRLVMYQLWMV